MKKKLLIVTPTLSRGGGERVVAELSKVFAEHLEVVFVLFEKKVGYAYTGRIVSLDAPISEQFLKRAFLFFVRFFKLKKVLLQERPDLVMSLGASAIILSILAAKDPIVRVDTFIPATQRGVFGTAFKVLAFLLLRRAALLIAVSRAIGKSLEVSHHVPVSKIRVVYNPVNTARIQELAKEPLAPAHEQLFRAPLVVAAGRLAHEKGHHHLIRAFSRVKERIPSARLAFVGDGELREKLGQLVCELGVEDSVHFLGWQENPFKFLARAQVFAFSSRREGLPNVLLEALACGVPIVSVDCRSGPREIIAPSTDPLFQTKQVEQGEYGVLLPVCDGKWRDASQPLCAEERMMADALIGLLENESVRLRFAEKAARRAQDFDIKTIAPQWSFLWE